MSRIDGISDQSLPAWGGSFATSPLSALLGGGALAAAPGRQVAMARYVVQWNVESEPTRGPAPVGDYRERFEAWLDDVHAIGLTPVVALTSYTPGRPRSAGRYGRALEAILSAAAAAGVAIPWVEPWNEPNDQGHMGPGAAASLADSAAAICAWRGDCRVIAGDVQDSPDAARFEAAYDAALSFLPAAWGVHPYLAVRNHDDANLLAWRAVLPGAAAAPVWFTEVGAYYCQQGEVLGLASQADDAGYLARLISALQPVHAFYDGFEYADGQSAPCSAGGGDDVELFGPGGGPRPAARVLLGGTIGGARLRFDPVAPAGTEEASPLR